MANQLKAVMTGAALALTPLMSSTALAQDVAYTYGQTGPGGGAAGGQLEFFEVTYANVGGQEFVSGAIDFEDAFSPEIVRNGGFWLAASDPGNAKGRTQELAILFADLGTNRITAYEYNGANGPSSVVDPGNLLGVFNNAITINERLGLATFDINVTNINAVDNIGPDWRGLRFEEDLGVWFHFGDEVVQTFNADGDLQSFGFREQGFIDFNSRPTTGGACNGSGPQGCNGPRPPAPPVPTPHPPTGVSEPATMALMGLGLAGIGLTRRRRSK